MSVEQANPWFEQAESDRRTAEALAAGPSPMQAEDIGCHVTAMCAQVIEKAIKGYVVLNGSSPKGDHRPDKYLPALLRGGQLLRYAEHRPQLSRTFDQSTRSAIAELFDLTPGGKDSGFTEPNTEYPWMVENAWQRTPVGAGEFATPGVADTLKLAQRVLDQLRKLFITARLGRAL